MLHIISREDAKNLGMKYYFTGIMCKHGHISERNVKYTSCRQCAIEKAKAWANENPEKAKARTNDWYQENRERVREYKRVRYQDKKEDQNKYYRELYANSESFKVSEICRALLKRHVRDIGYTKSNKTNRILGYTAVQLKERIESCMQPGMSWANYGEWHIDHINPVSRMVKSGIFDPKEINKLANLAPLWAEHNRDKRDKTLEEWLNDREEMRGTYGFLLSDAS
tara:strand:+ start:4877 stop:5551 length:675 start_codon:yes stop_codon:yes gene_type:complete